MSTVIYKPISGFNKSQQSHLLTVIKQVERKTFPTNEALDFDQEIKKRNTTLILGIIATDRIAEPVAYLVYVRMGKLALLHKICVVETHRRQGVARAMLTNLCDQLANHGCEIIQLWVDQHRDPARRLYSDLGFEEVQRLEDYYGLGRIGIRMVLALDKGS